jgi:hypothetical protein
MSFKNSLAYLISSQLPLHIRQDYPQFVLFLEKYYEFLDQDDQANGLLLNAATWSDINKTLDLFLPSFGEQFLQMFPDNSLVNKRTLIKFIREFYEAKGSEKSIEFLFRVFFNDTPKVIYPSEYILKASDGTWVKDKKIKVLQNENTPGNVFDLLGKYIKIKSVKDVGTVRLSEVYNARVGAVSKIAYEAIPTYELTIEDLDFTDILLPGFGASGQPLVVDGQIVAVTGNPLDNSFEFDPTETGIGLNFGIIQLTSHSFSNGDVVIYDPQGGTAIGGLIPYRHYYVKVLDADNIRLYGSKSTLNATSSKTFFKTSSVDFAENTITLPNHQYITGDLVVYQNAYAPLGGLTHRAVYYVIKIDANTIKLAQTLIDSDPRYVESGYLANKLNEEDDNDSQPYTTISPYNEINFTSSAANDYHILSKEYFINFTSYGTETQRFLSALDSKGSGYYASPIVSFYTEGVGSGATGKAILDDAGGISHIEILDSGQNYDSTTLVQFNNQDIETYLYLADDPVTKYGYLSRVLSEISILDVSGTSPYGFKVNEIYPVNELGSVGSYTIIYRDSALNYFASDYVRIGIDNKASIKINAIDSNGAPTAVSIFNPGRLWGAEYATVEVLSNTGNGTLTLQLRTGGIFEKDGRPTNRKGFLSDVNKLQDNYYYQNYSYVIRSKTSSINWMNLVKETVHPTGMAVFGELLVRSTLSFKSDFNILRMPVHEYIFRDEIINTGEQFSIDFVKTLEDSATTIENVAIAFNKSADSELISSTDNLASNVGKNLTDVIVPIETLDVVFNKSIIDVVYTTSELMITQGQELDAETTNTSDSAAFSISKSFSEIVSASDSADVVPNPRPSDIVTVSDSINSVVENTSQQENTAATDNSTVGYEKLAHHAAVTSESGVINIQDYWSETYAAADYVGREYTF